MAQMYSVVELTEVELKRVCTELAARLRGDEYFPVAILGIQRAGVHVSRAITECILNNPTVLEIEARRPTTKLKNHRAVASVLERLPRKITSAVRAIEHRYLTTRGSRDRAVSLGESEAQLLALPTGSRLLVVDDAADTGASLEAVRRAVLEVRDDLILKTMVLAVDHSVKPDLVNYAWREDVLLRGPWSLDA